MTMSPEFRRFGSLMKVPAAATIAAALGVVGTHALDAPYIDQTPEFTRVPTSPGAEIVHAIGKTYGAIIIQGLSKCPPVSEIDGNGSAKEVTPTVEIAQSYVGDPKQTDVHGSFINLHAARVTNQYEVTRNLTGNETVTVYCGPDNKDNGFPYDGVMLVNADAPDLITA